MTYLGWVVVGAGIGIAQLAWSLMRKPIQGGHPIQAFAFSAVAGALFYGTILWLIAKAF